MRPALPAGHQPMTRKKEVSTIRHLGSAAAVFKANSCPSARCTKLLILRPVPPYTQIVMCLHYHAKASPKLYPAASEDFRWENQLNKEVPIRCAIASRVPATPRSLPRFHETRAGVLPEVLRTCNIHSWQCGVVGRCSAVAPLLHSSAT